ncbi:hypothetical protein D3C87_1344380 [compost metagenome]
MQFDAGKAGGDQERRQHLRAQPLPERKRLHDCGMMAALGAIVILVGPHRKIDEPDQKAGKTSCRFWRCPVTIEKQEPTARTKQPEPLAEGLLRLRQCPDQMPANDRIIGRIRLHGIFGIRHHET